ncbi:uncharacterized protein LOC126370152 [Pectinophora gossypiella]|uniref:uncharacterized protein LOC126370152 n=1 Tax=Pectinophora gossypiella TaxID=13191 RepID=UPI00214E7E6C|nr:uncharacterized protein LOC126370152 [Pectinophora gossypiella]
MVCFDTRLPSITFPYTYMHFISSSQFCCSKIHNAQEKWKNILSERRIHVQSSVGRSGDVLLVETGRGCTLIHDGYHYHRHREYPSGRGSYWRCAARKRNKCHGTLSLKDGIATKLKEHLSTCERNLKETSFQTAIKL